MLFFSIKTFDARLDEEGLPRVVAVLPHSPRPPLGLVSESVGLELFSAFIVEDDGALAVGVVRNDSDFGLVAGVHVMDT